MRDMILFASIQTQGKKANRFVIQVKSRLATDCDRAFPVKEKAFDAFDYLIVAFLNCGYFAGMRKRHKAIEGIREPQFYTLPTSFIKEHHAESTSWQKVRTGGLDIERYRNEKGFELIAEQLGISYPEKK
jgi:hypothetical protein